MSADLRHVPTVPVHESLKVELAQHSVAQRTCRQCACPLYEGGSGSGGGQINVPSARVAEGPTLGVVLKNTVLHGAIAIVLQGMAVLGGR